MDPEAVLAKARAAHERAARLYQQFKDAAYLEALQEVDEAFADLDEWLSKGGFRPKAWIPTGPAADVGHEIPDPSDWP